MSEQLRQAALDFHEFPIPGKIAVTPTKSLETQHDLALAYSPGVAEPCLEIEKDPSAASRYTARANLVAVISNGTAVLGLGNIGALASKPVMEGKGVLFKKFAGINVFDIEINEHDPDKLIDIIASLEPTFGGINLEDIKAPECFHIEKALRERMGIPVFHDDQHGTAIIVGAAALNGLEIIGKNIADVRLVVNGAGASAIACCMIFDLSQKHERANRETFFGYFKDDKFIKRKGLGRVEQTNQDGNSLWLNTEAQWLDLYKNRRVVPGLSVMQKVTYEDEWLAEAYMETDYSTLSEKDFQGVINSYVSYLVKEGYVYED